MCLLSAAENALFTRRPHTGLAHAADIERASAEQQPASVVGKHGCFTQRKRNRDGNIDDGQRDCAGCAERGGDSSRVASGSAFLRDIHFFDHGALPFALLSTVLRNGRSCDMGAFGDGMTRYMGAWAWAAKSETDSNRRGVSASSLLDFSFVCVSLACYDGETRDGEGNVAGLSRDNRGVLSWLFFYIL